MIIIFFKIYLKPYILILASDCFLRDGTQPNLFSSLQKLLSDYILPYSTTFESSSWVQTRLFTIECEKILKKFHQIFQYIFSKFSKRNSNNLKKLLMSLNDFRKIFEVAELVEEIGSTRDLNVAFSLSIGFHENFHENEFSSERSCQLDYYEFVQAMARVAEKLSLCPVGELNVRKNFNS